MRMNIILRVLRVRVVCGQSGIDGVVLEQHQRGVAAGWRARAGAGRARAAARSQAWPAPRGRCRRSVLLDPRLQLDA